MDMRRKVNEVTITLPIRGDEVLLGRKVAKIGKGLINGWGGEREKGESVIQTAQREFCTESGLQAYRRDFESIGKIVFHNEKLDGRKFDVKAHLFLLRRWSGVPNPKINEMTDPRFWPIHNLPFHEMMPSDKDWFPIVLSGIRIEGETWQKWIECDDGTVRCVLVKPSEIRRIE